jgi:hypothetical protein
MLTNGGFTDGLTIDNLTTLLTPYKIKNSDFPTIFSHLDKDNDGFINWHEFVTGIFGISKIHDPNFYTHDLSGSKPLEADYQKFAMNVLNICICCELKNLKELELAKKKLWKIKNIDEKMLFRIIDRAHKGFIEGADLENFYWGVYREGPGGDWVRRFFTRVAPGNEDSVLGPYEFNGAVMPEGTGLNGLGVDFGMGSGIHEYTNKHFGSTLGFTKSFVGKNNAEKPWESDFGQASMLRSSVRYFLYFFLVKGYRLDLKAIRLRI